MKGTKPTEKDPEFRSWPLQRKGAKAARYSEEICSLAAKPTLTTMQILKQLTALTFMIIVACQPPQKDGQTATEALPVENPAAEGFIKDGSDTKAIELADQAMEAMGGRKKWDDTHLFSWNFFGARRLHWDKATGNVRIEFLKEDMQAIVNINSMEGRSFGTGR